MSGSLINFPRTPFADPKQPMGISRAWIQWLQNPQFITVNISTVIDTASGGTGVADTPADGQLLIGNGGGYTVGNLTAGPNVAITNGFGSITISVPGLAGMANQSPSSVAITGGSIAGATLNGQNIAVGAFGCNSKPAQTSFASGGPVVTTGATNITPYGYTTAAQADAIITLLNNIQAALVANGIMT